ncbi:MAG: hypothetical protein M1340_09570, partial [Actinobacteria bacterium]|nr:hypothetical protein [Actinomycetota bacterium]
LVLVVEHHPHRTFLQLFGIPLSCVHDSILSKDGASRKVGAIQVYSFIFELMVLVRASSIP